MTIESAFERDSAIGGESFGDEVSDDGGLEGSVADEEEAVIEGGGEEKFGRDGEEGDFWDLEARGGARTVVIVWVGEEDAVERLAAEASADWSGELSCPRGGWWEGHEGLLCLWDGMDRMFTCYA